MEDLRHDGISIGNVSRAVSKKEALPRNFSARTENVPNSTSVCSITVKKKTQYRRRCTDLQKRRQGLISSYVNHVCIFYLSILKTFAKFTEIDGIPFKCISLRAQQKKITLSQFDERKR